MFIGAGLALTAQSNDRADLALQAAIKLQLVDGDLKGAIAAYEKLVRGSNRAVAAQALLRIGECQEKLGDNAARQAYERLVKEFADQKDAVAAATVRLEALGEAKSALSYRQVWADSKTELDGTVSSDGRYLSYVDWDTGDLALHDLALNSNRRLTNTAGAQPNADFAGESSISRDGKQVAYSWYNGKTGRYDLRIATLTGTGFVQPRHLVDDPDIIWIGAYDWSPDGKWIAVQWNPKDRRSSRIGLVSTQDGAMRVLRSPSPPSSDARRLSFSPDGKYLGFDQAVDGNRDVFVIDLASGRESTAAAWPSQETMMGWSPDGKRLLYASDHRGSSMDLWMAPIVDGQPQGAPEMLQANIAPKSVGMTTSGALFLGVSISSQDVTLASVDLATGRLLSGPSQPVQTFVGSNMQPEWSSDGKSLAYMSRRGLGGEVVLAIRSLDTGRTRELHPQLRVFNYPRWSPDGRSFLCQGFDRESRSGIFRIDAATGDVSAVVTDGVGASRPRWSPDGQRVFYVKRGANREYEVIERNLSTGNERQLTQKTFVSTPYISPDGRFIATLVNGEANQWMALQLVATATGESRELLRVAAPGSMGDAVAWTPDSQGVLINRTPEGRKPEIVLVPLNGGQPRALPIDPSAPLETMRVHPDGRQIAYVSGQRRSEVWVLEHFLPGTTAK